MAMPERQKPKLVRVLNAKTGKPETINIADIKLGNDGHNTLTPELMARAEKLYERLGHYMKSKSGWMDGFLSDQHPDREIAIWERMANVVDRMWDSPTTRKLRRLDLIRAVVATTSGMIDVPSQVNGVTDEMVNEIRRLSAMQ